MWNGVCSDLRKRCSTFPKKKTGLPHSSVIAKLIFEVTGWELPYAKDREAYIRRYWKKFVCSSENIKVALEKAETEHIVFAGQFGKRPDFYDTPQWRITRYERLKLSGRKCQCCGALGGASKPKGGVVVIHVDHIKPRSLYPELSLSVENTQALCEDCNLGKGNWDETDWRPSPAS